MRGARRSLPHFTRGMPLTVFCSVDIRGDAGTAENALHILGADLEPQNYRFRT